jgi:hypothetical protein
VAFNSNGIIRNTTVSVACHVWSISEKCYASAGFVGWTAPVMTVEHLTWVCIDLVLCKLQFVVYKCSFCIIPRPWKLTQRVLTCGGAREENRDVVLWWGCRWQFAHDSLCTNPGRRMTCFTSMHMDSSIFVTPLRER